MKDEFHYKMIEVSNRRLRACKTMQPCWGCGSEQVQLNGWFDLAKWKCRKCGKDWEVEIPNE